jgi:hypothetical protein
VDELERLTTAFVAQGADRLQLIRELESEGGDRALTFLASVAASEDHEDYVRVEALKAVRVWGACAPEVAQNVGAILGRTIRSGDVDVVRGFAGMALSRFFANPGGFEALQSVVSDPREDEDVRHNALDALEHHMTDPRVQKLMNTLAEEPGSIGSAARRRSSSGR